MIKIHPNPKYASYAQCNRCGRKVHSFGNTEEEIKKEARLEGWLIHNGICWCDECIKQMDKEDDETGTDNL